MSAEGKVAFRSNWDSRIAAYRMDPSCEHAADLRMLVKSYLLMQKQNGTPLAGIGPALGIMDGVAIQHKHDLGLVMRVAMWYLRNKVLTPERPGWNDYWMAFWEVTRSREAAQEIHRRACHLTEWPMVRETAAWMVASVRSAKPEFEYAMRLTESSCQICGGVE